MAAGKEFKSFLEKVHKMESKQGKRSGAAGDENLADAVERLRGELRRKDDQVQAAQTEFAELSASSRAVEHELESDISLLESDIFRLSRLSEEQENTIMDLDRRLQIERHRAVAAETHASALNDEVAQLRHRLQVLEQENDDLCTKVRRLEATNEDLCHELERAQEEVIFAQVELEVLKEETGRATTTSNNKLRDLNVELKKYKDLVHYFSRVIAGEYDSDDEGPLQKPNLNSSKKANSETTGKADQEWIETVENLRTELKSTTEQLQATEDNYDKFMVASHELEKALVNENAVLKSAKAEVQAENVLLRCLLQTERERSAMEPWTHDAMP